jgi:hypothetical protein
VISEETGKPDHIMSKQSSAGMTESKGCCGPRMALDHAHPMRIEASQFELDASFFLLDLRTELQVEPDGFESGVFVEVISPTIDMYCRADMTRDR